ncbi:MAG: hypothetical protein WCL16_05185 [bacterium]
MMDNESVRDNRNSSVVLLALLLAVAVVWAIAGTVMAAKKSRALAETEKAAEVYRQDSEQKLADLQRQKGEMEKAAADAEVKYQESERGRQVALAGYRKYQEKLLAEKKPVVAKKPVVTGKPGDKAKPVAHKPVVHKAGAHPVTHSAARKTSQR